jgi:hypothetical protein
LAGENIRHPNPNEYLFVVPIARVDKYNNSLTEEMCVGTLVTRKDVLTAEHCLEGEELPYTVIIAGSSDFSLGTEFSFYWWISFDWWYSNFRQAKEFDFNDISVIRVRIR